MVVSEEWGSGMVLKGYEKTIALFIKKKTPLT